MLGHPLRMVWVVVCSYRLPRMAQAFASASCCGASHQGILAGCARANFMMRVLLRRAVARMCRARRA
eukprot:3532796-Pyramimonas_sp.AAC.1